MAIPTTQNLVPSTVGYNNAILSALSLPALIFDITTLKVIESNAYFVNEKDVSLNHLLTKHNYNFFKIADIQKIVQCLSEGQKYAENKIDNSGNNIRTFQVNVTLLPDNQNAFLYLNLLSENKFSNADTQKINEQTEFLKEIITSVHEGIGLISEDYTISFCNQSFGKIFEITDLHLTGINFLSIIGDDNKPMVIGELENSKTNHENSFELSIRLSQNLEKKIQVHVVPRFDEDKNYTGSFLTIIDITDRVQMECDLIKARDKAQESDRLKTTFLTNMSHEIRTPMNSILGFSSMLQLKGITRQKRDQYLDIIISRGKHLMEIINDILDITKLDEDQIQITPIACELNDLLRELHRNFSSNIKKSKKPVNLIMHTYFSDDQSTIVSDSFHLQQILSNLLNNSEKFTEEGFIEFGYMVEKENNILFYVRDTGIGVPAGMHEVIFERFRQADDSFTRIYGGMGLGLSICKGLVNLMGGNIWVESDGKTGATFYFSIPYHSGIKNIENHEQSSISDKSFLATKNILVVEDDMPSYEYLKEILSSVGCNVIHAGNGKDALLKFNESKSIDLILLDIQLPETNGYEIARSIRKSNAKIPIIAQTAHAMPEDRKKCIDAGCNDYITKPIQFELLVNTLKTYIVNR